MTTDRPVTVAEMCAILRRVLSCVANAAAFDSRDVIKTDDLIDGMAIIDAIEKEIEPCNPTMQHDPACPKLWGGPCACDPTPTSEASGASVGAASGLSSMGQPSIEAAIAAAHRDTAPPDLDAIRKAVERLREAGQHHQGAHSQTGQAIRALLALDVPAVVEGLHRRAIQQSEASSRDLPALMDARDSWQQRAEAAEARCRELTAMCDGMTNEARDMLARAEKAEAALAEMRGHMESRAVAIRTHEDYRDKLEAALAVERKSVDEMRARFILTRSGLAWIERGVRDWCRAVDERRKKEAT